MTNKNNTNNKNPYGHLLDKYLDSDHLDFKTKQQRKEEGKKRYGNLLNYAKPDNSALELMAKIEDDRIERRKQEAKERELADQRMKERIERKRWEEEAHSTAVRSYVESFIERKQAQMKADADKKEQKRKEAEKQKEIYDMIDSLMKISPESANAYIQAMKQAGAI